MVTFHSHIFSSSHNIVEDTGWKLVARGFLLTQESLRSQWQSSTLLYFLKGSTNIWLMLRLVRTFFLVIFANLLKGFVKPPWITISIAVHATCCEVLAFILARSFLYICWFYENILFFINFVLPSPTFLRQGGIGTFSSQPSGEQIWAITGT